MDNSPSRHLSLRNSEDVTPPSTPPRQVPSVSATPRTPNLIRRKLSWLLSSPRKQEPAITPSTVESDSFQYTFSPGRRGPFNGTFASINKPLQDIEKDKTRVEIRDEGTYATPTLLLLREQLNGYLNTQEGSVLSDAHGAVQKFSAFGESFEVNAGFQSEGKIGRVRASVSVRDDTSIRISSEVTLKDFRYSGLITANTVISHADYEKFLSPQGNQSKALVHDFLTTEFTIKMTHCFVPRSELLKSHVYEWGHRLDNFILNENVDALKEHNLIDLAKAYTAAVVVPETATHTMGHESLERDNSLETVPMLPESAASPHAQNLMSASSKVVPHYNQDAPNFSAFSAMESSKQQLVTAVNDCQKRFPSAADGNDPSMMIFESSTITISLRMAQYANVTLRMIQADLFLRRARLKFFEACLSNSAIQVEGVARDVFETQENKNGFCETLLNDLEHPLIASNEGASFVSAVRDMRDNTREFDRHILRGVVNCLYEQANQKSQELKSFCVKAQENSQNEIWKTAKKLLNETGLISQLLSLVQHTNNPLLRAFVSSCASYLSSNDDNRKLFKQFLSNNKKISYSVPVIDPIIKSLLKMSIDYTKKGHRKDFLAEISPEELVVAEGCDPFLMYTIRKILMPRQALIEHLERIEELNGYHVLFLNCPKRWVELKNALALVIQALSKEKGDGEQAEQAEQALKDKVNTLVFQLPPAFQEELFSALCFAKSHHSSFVIDDYIQALYDKTAEHSQSSSLTSLVTQDYFCFDGPYYRALSLKYGFVAFDHATRQLIDNILSRAAGGINSDSYKTALFFRHFYVGALFNGYLRSTPQKQERDRSFLYSLFSEDTNSWVARHFSKTQEESKAQEKSKTLEESEQRLARQAIVNISASLSHHIRDQRTPQDWIDELEETVQQYSHVKVLGYFSVRMLRAESPEPTKVDFGAIVLRKAGDVVTAYWQDTNDATIVHHKSRRENQISGTLPVPGAAPSFDADLINEITQQYGCIPSKPTSTPAHIIVLQQEEAGLTAYWMEGALLREKWIDDEAAHTANITLKKGTVSSGHQPVEIRKITQAYACAPLLKEHLRLLGDDWAHFIALCAWITALVNRYLFSPEQIAYIHAKIDTILKKSEEEQYFTSSLLNTLKRTWDQYCELEKVTDAAIQEWQDEKVIAMTNIAQLFVLGEEAQANDFQKTVWLNAALRFYGETRESFYSGASNKRVSCVIPVQTIEEIRAKSPNKKLSAASSPEIACHPSLRRSCITLIFGLISSHSSLLPSQRAAIRQGMQDIFKNETIRTLTLDGIVLKLSKEAVLTQRSRLIVSQIPDFVFSTSECDIFTEHNFAMTVSRRLSFIAGTADALRIDHLFDQLLAGLGCVAILAQKEEYHVFLPCLMMRLFEAFSVGYQYLVAGQDEIPTRVVRTWSDCIQKINFIAQFPVPYADQYKRFAGVWEEIRLHVFPEQSTELSYNYLSPKNRLHFLDLVAAYHVCSEFTDTECDTTSLQTIVANHWHDLTGYKIGPQEVKALYFIFAPLDKSSIRCLRERQEKLSVFFMKHVTGMVRLGGVLCVEVSQDCLLSSQAFSTIPAVNIMRDGQLESEHRSLRAAESLDQLTIDLAKIYAGRLEQGQRPMDYPIVFIYRPSLKTFGVGFSERAVVRGVEIYEENGVIVRKDCFVSDERDSSRISESYLLARAARMLPATQEGPLARSLEGIIRGSDVLNNASGQVCISSEFFNLLLELLQASMRFIEQMQTRLTPLSAAWTRPAAAVYDDPRLLSHCSENALIGLFVLGLVYKTLARQEKLTPGASAWWVCNLPNFFDDPDNGKKNVRALATGGIASSGMLQERYGSRGEQDPVKQALQTLDQELKETQKIGENRQKAYYDWFKAANPSGLSSAATSTTSVVSYGTTTT